MTIWVGIDLVSRADVARALRDHGRRYLDRVFTVQEIADTRGDALRLAERFAAKEATAKALRVTGDPLPWREIAVVVGADGAPSLELTGAARALADRRGVRALSLSMSQHRGETATAVVLARLDRPDAR